MAERARHANSGEATMRTPWRFFLRSRRHRRLRGIVGIAVALTTNLWAFTLPAKADAFSDVISVMNVIDQAAPGALPFTAADLQQYHDLIVNCGAASSTDDLLGCIEEASASGAGQQAGIPSWFPQLIAVYFDIEHKDYWGLVADAGEAAACAAAEIMTGVDVCGAIQTVVDAAKDVAKGAEEVAGFFSDLGSDLASVGEDVYCYFAGCGGSPPPPNAYDTANKFCAERGGLKSMLSHSGAVDEVDLICNDGTACRIRPGQPAQCSTAEQKAAAEKKRQAQNELDFSTEPQHWAVQFDAKWLPQCNDDQCRLGIRFVRTGITLLAQQRHDADPDYPWSSMALDLQQADQQAEAIVAESKQRSAGAKFDADLVQWKTDFNNTYLQQCADDSCTLGIGFIRYAYALGAQQQHDANPAQVTMQTLRNGYLKGADSDAKTLVQESHARQTAKVGKAIADLQFAIWAKQCSDSQCIHDLHGLLFFEMWGMEAEQQQHPDESTSDVLQKVGPEFAAAAKQIIDDSKARAKAKVLVKLSAPVLVPTPQRPLKMLPPAGAVAPIRVGPIRRVPGRTSVPTSTFCLFNSGPRRGQIQDYAPMSPLPVGTACHDGRGSSGVVVGKDDQSRPR